jgi:hypothetical protein
VTFTEEFHTWIQAINIAVDTETACNPEPTMTVDQNAACNFLANLCTLLASRYPTPLQDEVNQITQKFKTITKVKAEA